MKNKGIYITIAIIVILLVIGYNTNWFGLKNTTINSLRLINPITNMISCPTGCTLSTNTSGASQTASSGGNTYTCRCSDGATTAPIFS